MAYGSYDMKTGIDAQPLLELKRLIEGAVLLDARGGYFKQTHVEQVFTAIMDRCEVRRTAMEYQAIVDGAEPPAYLFHRR